MPIVTPDGCLAANVSLSDVRRLSHCKNDEDAHAMLKCNVLDVLRSGEGHEPSTVPLCLEEHDSLATAIQLLHTSSAHRLYIVRDRQPVGVLSLGSALRALARL
jgi:hypothetical protein